MNSAWQRPASAADVARLSTSAEDFGRSMRDWQHELRRISSRKDFADRIHQAPSRLRGKISGGDQCDAYLAAYVDWLCQRHGVEVPQWVYEPERTALRAWYDYPPLWQDSFVHAPSVFRRRGVFTRPEDPLHFRRGRPKHTVEHLRQRAAERQRRYRERIRGKLEKFNQLIKQPDGASTIGRSADEHADHGKLNRPSTG